MAYWCLLKLCKIEVKLLTNNLTEKNTKERKNEIKGNIKKYTSTIRWPNDLILEWNPSLCFITVKLGKNKIRDLVKFSKSSEM